MFTQKALSDGPRAVEHKGHIDDKDLPAYLWVVGLSELRCGLDYIPDLTVDNGHIQVGHIQHAEPMIYVAASYQ